MPGIRIWPALLALLLAAPPLRDGVVGGTSPFP
jgi:hypothetical protein